MSITLLFLGFGVSFRIEYPQSWEGIKWEPILWFDLNILSRFAVAFNTASLRGFSRNQWFLGRLGLHLGDKSRVISIPPQ